jgi:hypothetical protein
LTNIAIASTNITIASDKRYTTRIAFYTNVFTPALPADNDYCLLMRVVMGAASNFATCEDLDKRGV